MCFISNLGCFNLGLKRYCGDVGVFKMVFFGGIASFYSYISIKALVFSVCLHVGLL